MNKILNINDMNLINDVQINKYVKVMFGNKSSANGYEYKIGKVNIANNWNPNMDKPKEIGGFSVSTENKIIRWIFRGDTIYDVTFPDDSEIIGINNSACPHSVFLSNKIIITNPRKITDDMTMELYKKSELPEKTYFKVIPGCCMRDHIKTANKIFDDKININNIDLAISEFEDFCQPENDDRPIKEILYNCGNKCITDMYKKLINFKERKSIK